MNRQNVTHEMRGEIVSGAGLIRLERASSPLISCVLPAYNEEKNLASLVPLLCDQLEELSPNYEVIIVDDGSRDGTAGATISLAEKFPVDLLQLARNFGKECALTAGIDYARGDVVFLMDADFQHPIDQLPRFFAYWRRGFDMVYGVRAGREDENLLRRHLRNCFFSFMAKGAPDVAIEPNAGDFRLLDRRVVDAVRAVPERTRFMKGIYSWVGFKSIGVTYWANDRRSGRSTFSFSKLVELAITGLTSFTTLPLRLCSGIGAIVSALAMLYGLFIALRTLIFGIDLPGWATLVVATSFLSGIQLLSIGILGEYVSRVFTEVKQRPVYIIARHRRHKVRASNGSGNGAPPGSVFTTRSEQSLEPRADPRSSGNAEQVSVDR